MSMFLCARCDNLRDSDDGCAEWGPKQTELICVDCMAEVEDEANQEPPREFTAEQQRIIDAWEAEPEDEVGDGCEAEGEATK